MINSWKRILSTNAVAWGLPPGAEWTFLFHNNYQPANSSMNLLWFREAEEFPRVVTKMSRDRELLAREFRNLQTVYPLAPAHVPRPIHLGDSDGLGMLWMEGVPGRRIPPNREYPPETLTSSVDVVVSIHKALNKGPGAIDADRHARIITTPLNAVLQRGGPSLRAGGLAVLETATPGWLQALPRIPQHGDLFLDNILRYRGQFHLVDWENFGGIDLPFHDLLTLLLSFLWASAPEPEAWAVELKKQIPSLVERYAKELRLPAAVVATLLPVTLANWFYLHWSDGHAAANRMFCAIEHYFQHRDYWEAVFLGK